MNNRRLIKQIIGYTAKFQEFVKNNWGKVDNAVLNAVTKEYLTFLMYCVVFMFQNNDITDTEIDDFHKIFYKEIVKKGLLKEGKLLDYEKLSRKRYMDFYQILSEGKEKDQIEGKRLNIIIAKEVLYIQKLLSEYGEKENALGELYPELFSVCQELMLQIQLIFTEKK